MKAPECKCFKTFGGPGEMMAQNVAHAMISAMEVSCNYTGVCRVALEHTMHTVMVAMLHAVAGSLVGEDEDVVDRKFAEMVGRLAVDLTQRDAEMNALVRADERRDSH